MKRKMKKKTATTTKKNRIWTCRKCSEEFQSRSSLNEHLKTLHKEKEQEYYRFNEAASNYSCNFCSLVFADEAKVQSHVMKTHVESYSCKVCEETYTSAYEYSCHMQTHSKDKSFQCPFCVYVSIRKNGILNHINRIHYHKFYYNCKLCGKGFNDGIIFKEHENEHLGIQPFICVVCEKPFTFSRYLTAHQIRHHSVGIEGILCKNQCGICLRTFAKEKTLEKHIQSRHTKSPAIKKHLCDICGKGYVHRDKLTIHYRIHTGVKPFSCTYCGKSFIKKDYLIVHERVHTGEKPYSCEYCGKCFNQRASLRSHIRGHTHSFT